MASQLYTNNAASTLAAGISNVDTVLTLAAGTGMRFASPTSGDWQMLTLENADGTLTEIVKATARTDDLITVERGSEGNTPQNWGVGTKVQARLTAGMLTGFVTNKLTTGIGIRLKSDDAASADNSVAIGAYAKGRGAYSTALGTTASAFHNYSLCLGSGVAQGQYSVVLGGGTSWVDNQMVSKSHPCIPRDDYSATYGSYLNAGMESLFASQYLELGTPATWSANTNYVDGSVVRPVTPNGYQYRLWQGNWFLETMPNAENSGVVEPTWPANIEGSVGVGNGYWIASDLSVGADEVTPPGMIFYPTEVGFICFNYSGVTAAPFVSIGTAENPTLLVNNQQLSNITGASMRHVFTGFKHGIGNIRYKLQTAATGASARFHGRFYAKGIFIQVQG